MTGTTLAAGPGATWVQVARCRVHAAGADRVADLVDWILQDEPGIGLVELGRRVATAFYGSGGLGAPPEQMPLSGFETVAVAALRRSSRHEPEPYSNDHGQERGDIA